MLCHCCHDDPHPLPSPVGEGDFGRGSRSFKLTMPLKRLYRLQRARLTATPLALQPQLGFKGRLLRYALLLGVLLLAAFLGMRHGQYQQELLLAKNTQAKQNQIQSNQQRLATLEQEKALLTQQLTVMGAERDALKRDLLTLQRDTAVSRETLSFFESLLQSNDRSRLASFVACDLQMRAADRLGYRLLLVQGTDKTTELAGRLLLSLQFVVDGKKQSLTLGDEQSPVLALKHYHRAEGEFQLPENAAGPMLMDVRFVEAESKKILASCQKKI